MPFKFNLTYAGFYLFIRIMLGTPVEHEYSYFEENDIVIRDNKNDFSFHDEWCADMAAIISKTEQSNLTSTNSVNPTIIKALPGTFSFDFENTVQLMVREIIGHDNEGHDTERTLG